MNKSLPKVMLTQFYKTLLTLSFLFVIAKTAQAQNVNVTATAGTLTGSYATLKDAFDAINNGSHQGVITATVIANTVEIASAQLNASGSGLTSYTSISIQPSGGAIRTISGNIAGPLLDFNGADNVSINGLNSGGNGLTITNTNNSTTAATIRFINDASDNTVTNCRIFGSTTGPTSGIILLSSGSATGNDRNTISNNTLDSASATLPTNGILISGSVGFENDTNIISNNNIGNYFSATAASNGIFVSAGANAIQIIGNRFYQSFPRAYTNANAHRGIAVVTGTNHLINNNTIGFANNSGTGKYIMTGAVATTFVGILGTFATTGDNTISNNSVTEITLSTTATVATGAGVFAGISVTSGNVNILSNLIGALSDTSSINVTTGAAGALIGIHSSSNSAVLMQGNQLGALRIVGSGATIASALHGINISGVATSLLIRQNTIGNGTADNMRAGILGNTTGNTLVNGIQTPSTSTSVVIASNTIQNLASFSNSTGTYVRGIFTNTSASTTSTSRIDSNTIFNLTGYGALTGLASGLAAVQGIHFSPGINSIISNNTIYNLFGMNTGTTHIIVTGIGHANATNTSIFNNRIYNLSNAATGTSATSPGIAAGIALRSAASDLNVFNNMIALGSGQTTNTSFVGIYCQNGSSPNPNFNVLNNTVHITGAATSGSQPTFAFLRGDLSVTTARTTTVLLRNNIFSNQRTGGSNRHYAIANNFLATGPASRTGWPANASNNNILLASNPDSVGYWTRGGNLQRWRDSSLCDANSFASGPVTFVDPTSDLHLTMGTTPTYAESNGATLTQLNNDFDAQSRPGPTGSVNGGGYLYDIGADEFDGVSLDASPPVISYSPIQNSASLTNLTLPNFASVLDFKVDTNLVNRPRLYFKKRSDKDTIIGNTIADTGWKYVEATNTSSPFSFTINYGILFGGSGVSINDTIQYFVVAQDTIPLVSANPSTGFVGTTVSAITKAPTNPNSYIIVDLPLSGNYDIGTGLISPNFTNLTQAFRNLNLRGVSGPVTFTLKDAAYDSIVTNEVFPITVNAFTGGSPTNTVTLRPDIGVNAQILSLSLVATFDINGAKYFTIDGSQGSLGGFTPGTNLVVSNLASAPAIRFINDAIANRVINTEIRGINPLAPGSANAGLISFGTTTGTQGNDSNIIRNCFIRDTTGIGTPTVAISSIGSGTTNQTNNDFNIIDSCNIFNYFNAGAASVGLYVGNNNSNWQITNNKFYQTGLRTFTSAVAHRALWITPNTASLTYPSGFSITNNYIGGSAADGSGYYSLNGSVAHTFNGMDISVGIGTVSTVSNNTITNITDTSASVASNTWVGINLTNGNVSTTNNIIGSTTNINSITYFTTGTSGGGLIGIRTGGGLAHSIRKNTISGITVNGNATTAFAEFFGINLVGGTTLTVDSNTIGGSTLSPAILHGSTSSTATGASRMSGIFGTITSGTPFTVNITNNTIDNLTTLYEATGTQATALRGIHFSTSIAGNYAIVNNKVTNLYSYTRTTGSGINSAIVGIGVSSSAGTYNISQNTIHSLVLKGSSTTTAVQVEGIFSSVPASGEQLITRNLIHSLSLDATNPFAIISGIEASAGNNRLINNIIRLGIDSAGNAITTPCSFQGIVKSAGNTNVFFNTSLVGGSGVGADFNRTFAFMRTGAGADNVSNNVFYNIRSNASSGAGHFASSINNNTNLTMNFNLLRGDSIGVLAGAPILSINAWKGTTAVDANSVSSTLDFINPFGNKDSINLRINPTIPTPVEAYGSVVGGTGTDIDFDGQIRSSLTPVDLGANAGNFTPSDLAPPVISYTALQTDTIVLARSITANITDATGIYLAGPLRPRIYYKKGINGAFVNTQGTFSNGSNINSNWIFTIDPTLLSGIVGEDTIYYFITAQDSTSSNNLGSTPGGIEGTDVNTISTFPVTFNYRVIPFLSGTFLIGSGQPFTTLTGANGIFNYLNSSFVSSDIELQITSDIEEPGTVALNELNETSAGSFKVRIVPGSATLFNITGSVSTAGSGLIRLNGADRVNIDGRFAGSGRFLRFMNRPQAGVTILLQNDAMRDTITNCIIEGTNNTTGTILIGTSTKIGGLGNDSNAIIGCIIRDTLGSLPASNVQNTGINSSGTAGLENDLNTISNNEIYNFGFNAINLTGTGTGNNWNILNNKIYQVTTRNNALVIINVQGGGGHLIKGNSIGGQTINRADTAFRTSSTLIAIQIAGASVNTALLNTIDSNIISNLAATGTGALNAILVSAGTSLIKNNTIGGGAAPYDTLLNGGSNGFITISGGVSHIIENNTISHGNFYRNAAIRHVGIALISTAPTLLTVRNNTIFRIWGNSTSLITSTTSIAGIMSTSVPTNGSALIENNLIYNIRQTNTGTAAYGVAGIFFNVAANSGTVKRNRIYDITAVGTGTGTSAPTVTGINVIATTTSSRIIQNNQITLGDSVTNESVIIGIREGGTATTAGFYDHNSIFINGNTSAGANHSYGILRTSTANTTLRNNLIFNKRTTSGSGRSYAIGSSSTTGITGANILYNALFVNDTAFIAELPTGVPNGWAALTSLYTTTYNTNWAPITGNVLPSALFQDTLVGNLNIVNTSDASWYVNGKGLPLASVSEDFASSTAVRSSSIATGSTDIGSDEFSTTTLPIPASTLGNIAGNDSTSYFFASRLIAKINWSALGILPSAVQVLYHSGSNPTNTLGGSTFTNAFWDIQATGGSGYEYKLTLAYDSAILGTVTNVSNLGITRYQGSGTNWNLLTTNVNNLLGLMDADTTETFGIFAGTDRVNNPLPVALLNFTAKPLGNDAMLQWNTASELNNKGFDVERSLDGKRFETIQFIKGVGNSNRLQSYTFKDQNALKQQPVLYYRLRQVDFDGTFTYSEVKQVRTQQTTLQGITAAPNPFSNNLSILMNSENSSDVMVTLYDLYGRKVMAQKYTTNIGNNILELDGVDNLAAGVYTATVIVEGEQTAIKLIKK
ncbi:MAG: T9SS type A sorting domain-containing protein [Bacteroidia bacterium]|jgi:hypothetical protein|nr:T9SS type A sorting domain-containing protein [Bacteroidia bacterium]